VLNGSVLISENPIRFLIHGRPNSPQKFGSMLLEFEAIQAPENDLSQSMMARSLGAGRQWTAAVRFQPQGTIHRNARMNYRFIESSDRSIECAGNQREMFQYGDGVLH
jgi:hypothetical protein